MTTPFLNRSLHRESDISRHRLDVNPEASLFQSTDSGATEAEYLGVMASLIGAFKPTHLMETGTANGDGAACLLQAAASGSHVLSICNHELPKAVRTGLDAIAQQKGSEIRLVEVHTIDLIHGNANFRWSDLTDGKVTFAFLDTSLKDRADEFVYITDPQNGVLDFSRPLCICIHDMSRYRHPHDADTLHLANTVATVESKCRECGWQYMRLNQSRGLMILTKYPDVAGIDGKCIVPEMLISEEDRNNYMAGSDPYLITDYYPLLRDIVRQHKPKRVLEIGVRYGYSLATMLGATDSIETLFAIDVPINSERFVHGGGQGFFEHAQANINLLHEQGMWPNVATINFLELDSQSVQELPSDIDQLDLAYIDGDHSNNGCLHDLTLVLPRMKPDGIMVVDDADLCDLRRSVEEWAKQHQLASSYLPDSSGRGRVLVQVTSTSAEVTLDPPLHCHEYSLRVVTPDRGDFSKIQNKNVLIYFPHGFGDWVHFSHIQPLLEPTNHYWMFRYGDDTTSVMEGSPCCDSVLLGVKPCSDGDLFGRPHLGIDFNNLSGEEMQLSMPNSLYKTSVENAMHALLFTPFFESWGGTAFPFHTKARSNLRGLVSADALEALPLNTPLKSCINFDVPKEIAQWVEAKLRNYTGFGERKLCIIGRNGYTATGKNWGHLFRENEDGQNLVEGEECREFMRLMLKKDKRWVFLVIEDRLFEGYDTVRSREINCFSYAELFGTPDDVAIPFGYVMKTLVRLASLSVGVPAGAHHLCMVNQDLPSIGLWIEHFPSWYDEPKEASLHVISRNVRDLGLDTRPGSFTSRGDCIYRVMPVETRRLYGEQVLGAAEQLLSI